MFFRTSSYAFLLVIPNKALPLQSNRESNHAKLCRM